MKVTSKLNDSGMAVKTIFITKDEKEDFLQFLSEIWDSYRFFDVDDPFVDEETDNATEEDRAKYQTIRDIVELCKEHE